MLCTGYFLCFIQVPALFKKSKLLLCCSGPKCITWIKSQRKKQEMNSKWRTFGTSLVVQWLRLCTLNAGGPSLIQASLVAQTVKNLPAMQETQVWSLSWEDPLKKGMTTHSSILAWEMPWTERPGGLQCMGLQRVGHNWVINTCTFSSMSSLIWKTRTSYL